MTTITPWLEITISGSIYTAALAFILLRFLGKTNENLKQIAIDYSKYFPFLGIILLFFSYLIGLTAYLLVGKIISLCFYPDSTEWINKIVALKMSSPEAYDNLSGIHSNFIMFRHLFISTFLLGFSFSFWARKSSLAKSIKRTVFWTCMTFSIMFLFAYFVQREFLVTLKNSLGI